MENWLTFLLVNIVLVIVLGVITNLITPSIKSAYDKSVFSSKKRRIKALMSEYYTKKHFQTNPNELILKLIKDIAVGLGMLTMSVFQIAFWITSITFASDFEEMIVRVFISVFAGSTFVIFNLIVREYFDFILFEDYEKKVMAKIRKMGIPNPEELIKQAEESNKAE